MTWRPLTYDDYKIAGGESLLLDIFGTPSKPDRWYAGCPCSPEKKVPAFCIVDCRAIDNSLVLQDWACDSCWTSWITASAKTSNIIREVEERLAKESDENKIANFNGKDLKQSLSIKELRDLLSTPHPQRKSQIESAVARELKEEGGFIPEKPLLHCFTKSQWIEMHGGPTELVNRFRGTKADFR